MFSGEPGARLYRSGDRVRWRPDGVLEFLGRFDNQVKIRGYRVEPDEVASCIAEHECVRQAVVVPHRAASGSAQLLAYVVPKSEDYSAAELRSFWSVTLPSACHRTWCRRGFCSFASFHSNLTESSILPR